MLRRLSAGVTFTHTPGGQSASPTIRCERDNQLTTFQEPLRHWATMAKALAGLYPCETFFDRVESVRAYFRAIFDSTPTPASA